MSVDAGAALSEGQHALEAGRWSAAKDAFETALGREESGEARFGLGIALWWLGQLAPALRCWERAYAAHRRRPDPPQAVMTAIYLSLAYSMSFRNGPAARGWLGRAASMTAELELTEMKGWVLLCRASLDGDVGRPQAAADFAREAREIGRRSGDADLELCAMCELGAALVELGRLEDGTALLDEAMAGALAGEGRDLDAVVLVSCRTITSCSRAADIERALQWIRAADDFNQRYGSTHLYTTCRIHYGGILFATGEWTHAERELRAALEHARSAEPALCAEAIAKLAELRLAQGRIEEATRLLEGYEHHAAAAYALALVRLATGETAVAASLLRRGLREIEGAGVESAMLLELLVETELGRGAGEEAATGAERLATLASRLQSDVIVARGERALGRTLAATGDTEAAVAHLERALAAFARIGMPHEVGRSRLLLARALAESERETAVVEARAALDRFEDLGAARDADAAAGFLRSLGVKAARSGPKGIGLLTKRELEVLGLLGEGFSNPAIADRLVVSRKTVEHHVASVLRKLDLASRGEATAYAVRHVDPEVDFAKK